MITNNKFPPRLLWAVLVILTLVTTALTSCSDAPTAPPKQHTEATMALMRICDENEEVRSLLEHAIKQAAEINPDRQYNPAQTLEEFYDFIDWNVRQLPWDVMIHHAPNDYGSSL